MTLLKDLGILDEALITKYEERYNEFITTLDKKFRDASYIGTSPNDIVSAVVNYKGTVTQVSINPEVWNTTENKILIETMTAVAVNNAIAAVQEKIREFNVARHQAIEDMVKEMNTEMTQKLQAGDLDHLLTHMNKKKN